MSWHNTGRVVDSDYLNLIELVGFEWYNAYAEADRLAQAENLAAYARRIFFGGGGGDDG